MTKNDIIIPAVFGLILVAIYLGFIVLVPRPSLTIKIDGATATTLTAKDITASQPVVVRNGVITPANPRNIPNVILVKLSNGKNYYLRFPDRGNKLLDFSDRMTVSTTTHDYGIYRQSTSAEMYSYTDEEIQQIENGTLTRNEVEERIRKGK